MSNNPITESEITERGFDRKYGQKTTTIAVIAIVIIFALGFITANAVAETKPHYESDYVEMWCQDSKEGKHTQEYLLPDKKRVDCFIDRYDESKHDWAVEFDFSYKWAEALGQSLYYASVTDADPAVALIQKHYTTDEYYKKHYDSLQLVNKEHNLNITVFCIGKDGKDMECPE